MRQILANNLIASITTNSIWSKLSRPRRLYHAIAIPTNVAHPAKRFFAITKGCPSYSPAICGRIYPQILDFSCSTRSFSTTSEQLPKKIRYKENLIVKVVLLFAGSLIAVIAMGSKVYHAAVDDKNSSVDQGEQMISHERPISEIRFKKLNYNLDPQLRLKIGITSVGNDVQLSEFQLALLHALNEAKPSSAIISRDFELVNGQIESEQLRIIGELLNYDTVFYNISKPNSERLWIKSWIGDGWARDQFQRIINYQDLAIIVANGETKPESDFLKEHEEYLDILRNKPGGLVLVLLWSENQKQPTNTKEWINLVRPQHFFHVRMPDQMSIDDPDYAKLNQQKKFSDISRLARILRRTAIGVVLGGGGARGAAHLGVLKRLIEQEVPIDFVAGVSIGSFVGALYCQDPNIDRVFERAKLWFDEMAANKWRKFFTQLFRYSKGSFFSDHFFNKTLKKVFGDASIEDFWIPFFCVSYDIQESAKREHRVGSAWRFVRSSMGFLFALPPMNDPGYGLLVDGGVDNNLPADIMKRQPGIGVTFAVDVGANDINDINDFNMLNVLTKLVSATSIRTLNDVKANPFCYYFRPPVQRYSLLDFGRFEEICNAAYLDANRINFKTEMETILNKYETITLDMNEIVSKFDYSTLYQLARISD